MLLRLHPNEQRNSQNSMKEKKSKKPRSHGKDVSLWAHVKPRAAGNRILGWNPQGFLEVQIKALPQGGEANRACIHEIACALGVPRNHVILEKGLTSRHKKFRIQGVSNEDVEVRLAKDSTSAS